METFILYFPNQKRRNADDSGNVSNANSRAMLICTEKFLFLTDHKVS